MAISALTAFEVQTGGSDTNNTGGFRGGAFIAAPTTPSVSNIVSGGSVAANTYYFVYTYTDGLGDTVISPETSTTTTGSASTITATSPAALTGATLWSCYVGTVSGGPYFPQGTGLTIGSNRVITTTPPTTGTQPRGVGRSQGTSRFVVIDNSTITCTTPGANSNVLTFTGGYTPTGSDVGNILRTTAGTNINFNFFEITAVTTTTWTVTGAVNLTGAGGAGAAVVGGMGGAFASPGQAVAVGAGGGMFVKNGTYTIANGTVNTAGNRISLGGLFLCGYSSNRHMGNNDTKPIFDAGAASMTMVTTTSNPSASIETISFTNSGSNATVTGLSDGAVQSFRRNLSFSGIAVPLSVGGTFNHYEDLYMTGCGTISPGNGCQYIRLVNVSSTATIFNTPVGAYFKECIFVSSGVASSTAAVVVGTGLCDSCIVYGSSGHGFNLSVYGSRCENCIVYGGVGTGYVTGQLAQIALVSCASGGNGTNFDKNFSPYQMINCVTLSGDPFTNAAGGDFSLISSGAGSACRSAGVPGAFPTISTIGFRDIGAASF